MLGVTNVKIYFDQDILKMFLKIISFTVSNFIIIFESFVKIRQRFVSLKAINYVDYFLFFIFNNENYKTYVFGFMQSLINIYLECQHLKSNIFNNAIIALSGMYAMS